MVFESWFESGNLKRAIKTSEYEYELHMRPDYNSQGYTQWFYFKITNAKVGIPYKFNITNFCKNDSHYNQGMKVLFYSKWREEETHSGWFWGGNDICYYPTSTR